PGALQAGPLAELVAKLDLKAGHFTVVVEEVPRRIGALCPEPHGLGLRGGDERQACRRRKNESLHRFLLSCLALLASVIPTRTGRSAHANVFYRPVNFQCPAAARNCLRRGDRVAPKTSSTVPSSSISPW